MMYLYPYILYTIHLFLIVLLLLPHPIVLSYLCFQCGIVYDLYVISFIFFLFFILYYFSMSYSSFFVVLSYYFVLSIFLFFYSLLLVCNSLSINFSLYICKYLS